MKKAWVIIVLVVVVVGGAGAYLMMHKSNKSDGSVTAKTSTSSQAMKINNSVMMSVSNSTLGTYLTDPSGKALYTYNADTSGVSNCTGSCLAAWPAYVDSGATTGLPTDVGTITRSDDSKVQYTYKGMPLYYFASDSTGQVTGNGVGNFTVAKP